MNDPRVGQIRAELGEDALDHLYLIYFGKDQLDLCGCNAPSEAWRTVAWVLELCPLYEGGWQQVEGRFTVGGAHLLLGLLEHAGLIEHSVTIVGSRLTPKGEWVRDRLRTVPNDVGMDDVLDATGYPHPYDPHRLGACPDDCPTAMSWRTLS